MTGQDVEAILCVLPLVPMIGANSDRQNVINAVLCESAAKKISAHQMNLEANEIRVISAALQAAVLILTDPDGSFSRLIDDDWKKDLSAHFFTINRLNTQFQNALQPLLKNES